MVGEMLVPGVEEAFAKEYPLGRITNVEDVAAVTLFAVSDECFMTGETFHVTGGLCPPRNPPPEEKRRFASGAGAHRPSLAGYIMVGLVFVVVFIMLELGRPRRGVSAVRQMRVYDPQAAIKGDG